MTNPTPDPLALAEEAFATALGEYVSLVEDRAMTHDVPARKIIAASGQVKALFRAAHEENRRLRGALEKLRGEMPKDCTCDDAYGARNLVDPQCGYHDYGSWWLRVIDGALAGGKGEG